jgi:hypothetical protein
MSTSLMLTPGAAQLLAGGADRRGCSSDPNTTNEKPRPPTGSSQWPATKPGAERILGRMSRVSALAAAGAYRQLHECCVHVFSVCGGSSQSSMSRTWLRRRSHRLRLEGPRGPPRTTDVLRLQPIYIPSKSRRDLREVHQARGTLAEVALEPAQRRPLVLRRLLLSVQVHARRASSSGTSGRSRATDSATQRLPRSSARLNSARGCPLDVTNVCSHRPERCRLRGNYATHSVRILMRRSSRR